MEYNTRTRVGIWMCLLLMLVVLCFVLAGVFQAERMEQSQAAGATKPDEDAIYVGAKPEESPSESTCETTESTSASTEKKALYYVTVSGDEIVVLDEYGEVLHVLSDDTEFLPKSDLDALRAGIALYTKEELDALKEDLS